MALTLMPIVTGRQPLFAGAERFALPSVMFMKMGPHVPHRLMLGFNMYFILSVSGTLNWVSVSADAQDCEGLE